MKSNEKRTDTGVFLWRRVIAGGIGGMIGATLTHPLDVIRTRLQSTLHRPTFTLESTSSSTFRSILDIAQREGRKGLFRGLSLNVLGVMPARAMYFASYGYAKRTLTDDIPSRETDFVHMVAAASAAMFTSTAVSPLGVVKTRMQLNNDYVGVTDCVRKMFEREGVAGFYRGLTASYWGATETVLQFIIYERLKKMIANEQEKGNEVQKGWLLFGAAATSKLIASTVTYPHEVVRTRMREETANHGHSFLSILRRIREQEGWKSLYRGMTAHLLRVVPNTAIVFFTFEVVLAWLDEL